MSTSNPGSDVPWGKLERALELQDFVTLGLNPVTVEAAQRSESEVPRVESVLFSEKQERQWAFIVERLVHLQQGSATLSIRPDAQDLLLVVGRRDDRTDPSRVRDHLQHVEWVLRNLTKALVRFRAAPEVIDAMGEVAESTDLLQVKVPAASRSTSAEARAVAAKRTAEALSMNLRINQLTMGVTAARVALNLLRFCGTCRCLVIYADTNLTEDENSAWTKLPQRVRRLSLKSPRLTRAVAEACSGT